MNTIVTLIALCIALWQLKLQLNAIRQNGRVNSLIHIAGLLREKIQHHEQIIANKKSKNEKWAGHAHRVNTELRPLLNQINQKLIDSVSQDAGSLDIAAIRQALKLESDKDPLQGIEANNANST